MVQKIKQTPDPSSYTSKEIQKKTRKGKDNVYGL